MPTNENSTTLSSTKPLRPCYARMVQNFHLVWLDGSIDAENNDDCRNSITELRKVINTVNTFIDVDECIDFITDITEEKTFMMVSEAFSQIIVPVVQDIPQISCVYIFCKDEARHETSANQWSKMQGIYKDITPICQALKRAAFDCDHNSVSISFIKTTDGTSKQNLDILDPSFMYTQILKEILPTIDFEQKHINEFLTYCRAEFAGNNAELENIDKIEIKYRDHEPIWWYTCEFFLYSMLNKTLRTMKVDLIIKMGFFVRDLHNNIAALHAEQFGGHHHSDTFTVYRGQGLSPTDFDQLKQTKGGLLAFNNFLSTSTNSDVSLAFARRTMATSTSVGTLFILNIDPSISATPFANIGKVSYFKREEEILFSMHSVFRIGQVKQIDWNSPLWQVDLTLTGDNDPQLQALTESIREETQGSSGWDRLGRLMIQLGQFNKAEELCDILLQKATDEGEKAHLFHQLGRIEDGQGKHAKAAEFYEKSIKIKQKIHPSTHPDLASSYSNIGEVYNNMGKYSKAFSYYEKALEIQQKTLPANHPDLATSYNNIGEVYNNMGEYSKALSYYEKALEILQKTLPANHPNLATSYNNIGVVYDEMGEYSKALSYYEKAIEILQKTLPANHPHLANSYSNIGGVYQHMGEYSKALSYYEKVLKICQKTLPRNHPNLANSYNNIGAVYYHMNEYSTALPYYEKAVEILQKILPSNHPHLTTSQSNINLVYREVEEHLKPFSAQEKALHVDTPEKEKVSNKNIEIQPSGVTKFQFVVIDISKRLSELAAAMLKALYSMTQNSIFIFDDSSAVDFDDLPKKTTILFVSSQFLTTMKTKPKEIEAIFILENDENTADHRERFASDVDLIFQLADEIYRCYKKEAGEYSKSGDSSMAEISEDIANRIHGELKKVCKSMSSGKNTSLALTDTIKTTTATTLIWLTSESQDDTEVKKAQSLFSEIISSFATFNNEHDYQNYLQKKNCCGTVFLIIGTDYNPAIITALQPFSNIQVMYLYGQSSLENESVIKSYNHLCFRLTYDLIHHYNKLGSYYSDKQDAKIARDMFMKVYELYNILAKL